MVVNYDSVVLIGAILNKADDDCSNGVLEACCWLTKYGVPLATESNLGSVSHHLKQTVKIAVKKIQTGELKADYSLCFEKLPKTDDDRKHSPTAEKAKRDVEKMKDEIAKNPEITNFALSKIIGRSTAFISNHRKKIVQDGDLT